MHLLFVCTGNAARSQMAEGWARHLAPAALIESGGTHPAGLSSRAVAVMAEVGIDISAQSSKSLEEAAWRNADIVITLCGSARENCVALLWSSHTRRKHWRITDPVSGMANDNPLIPFRMARDDIHARLEEFLKA